MNNSALVSRRSRSIRALAVAVITAFVAALLIGTGGISAAFADGGTASLSGTVTGSDTAGAGVAEIDVQLSSVDGSYFDYTTTGNDGTYSFSGIPANNYTLTFQPEGGVNYLVQWWRNATGSEQPTQFTIAEGNALTGYNAVLQAGATISGNVDGVDAPGVGLENVEVSAQSKDGSGYGDVQTDANGNYSIVGLPAGQYQVGFTPNDNVHTLQWWNNEPSFANSDAFNLPARGSVAGIDAHLHVGMTISGTVNAAGSPDVPLAGANVIANGHNSETYASATTDADGNYTLSALPPDSYTVQFQSPDGGTYATQYWQNANSSAQATAVVVTDQAVTGIDGDLLAGASISGTIYAPGSPKVGLAGAQIALYEATGGGPVANGQTDDQGNYTLTNLAPGSYSVGIVPSFGSNAVDTEWWGGSFIQTGAQTLTLAAGQARTGIDQQLIVGSTLSGTVLAGGPTPTPDAYALVTIWSSDEVQGHNDIPPFETTTDASGNYSFANVAPGAYTVFFGSEAPGLLSQWWKNKKTQATATRAIVVDGKAKTGVNATLKPYAITPGTPRITGRARVGSTLTARPGKWKPGVIILTYQWMRDGAEIPKATAQTYTPTAEDLGATLTVEVTGTVAAVESQGESELETSAPTVPVTPAK
jgi:protocatechuate 3,4-dioxygenase beta subunit